MEDENIEVMREKEVQEEIFEEVKDEIKVEEVE